MNEEIIKEEKELDTRTCDEKLADCLDEIECKHQTHLAKLLYKKGLYHQEEVKEFDLTSYEDFTYKSGVKGYSVYLSNEGQLVLVKELSAEEGDDAYGYNVIYLAKVNEEDMPKIMEYKPRLPIFTLICYGLFVLLLLLGFVDFFIVFFDTLSSGFDYALQGSFFYIGGFLIVGLGLFILLTDKLFGKKGPRGHKCCCK